MNNGTDIHEAIKSVNRYRGEIIVVAIHKTIFGNKEKINNVIRDIYFLSQSGANVVVIHFNENIKTEAWVMEIWGSLEKVIFLNDLNEVQCHINTGSIPVIYCRAGDDHAVVDFSLDIGAKKIIYITGSSGVFEKHHNEVIRDADIKLAKDLIEKKIVSGNMLRIVKAAISACERSNQMRFHITSSQEGALLKEVFSAEGFGTMICSGGYKGFRFGKKSDIYDIHEIINSLARKTSVSLDYLHDNIEQFIVYTVDERSYGCILANNLSSNDLEISYLCANDQLVMKELLDNILKDIPINIERVFIDIDKNSIWLPLYPWLGQAGFRKCSHEEYGPSLKKGGNVYLKKI